MRKIVKFYRKKKDFEFLCRNIYYNKGYQLKINQGKESTDENKY